jgi:transcriptional regulator with XRE-family HTH domain
MDDIILRIKELMKKFDLNQTVFADKIGMKQQNLSRILTNKVNIGNGVINKIVLSFDVNKEWILTGKGEMLSEKRFNDAKILDDVHFMYVPFIPIYARAGYMTGYGDPEYIDELSTIPVLTDRTYKGKYRRFEVEGDSMDDGTRKAICDGDKILCREVKRDLWRDKLHIRDWYFVLVSRYEGITIKQITDHNVETGDVICHPLNSIFEDFSVNLDDVSELYNVIKIIDRNTRI